MHYQNSVTRPAVSAYMMADWSKQKGALMVPVAHHNFNCVTEKTKLTEYSSTLKSIISKLRNNLKWADKKPLTVKRLANL